MTSTGGGSSIGILRDSVENLAKFLTVFAGSIYVIGYFVTATRLAEYGVPSINFFEAQYIIAGIIPGIFLWLTILVLISAYRYVPYKPQEYGQGTKVSVWLIAYILWFITLVVFVVLAFVIDNFPLWLQFLFILFGELSLWIIIVAIKYPTYAWEAAFRFAWKNSFGERMGVIVIIILLIAISIFTLYRMWPMGRDLYVSIPQAYGGGKPLPVILYVDDGKVPAELIDTKADGDVKPSRTIPLHLVFRTSNEYIVDPIETDELKAWVIDTSAVFAMMEKPE